MRALWPITHLRSAGFLLCTASPKRSALAWMTAYATARKSTIMLVMASYWKHHIHDLDQRWKLEAEIYLLVVVFAFLLSSFFLSWLWPVTMKESEWSNIALLTGFGFIIFLRRLLSFVQNQQQEVNMLQLYLTYKLASTCMLGIGIHTLLLFSILKVLEIWSYDEVT